MSGISIITEGELTPKQRQSMEIVEDILFALMEHESLDWKRLLEKTKPLSKGALHRWLVELVQQGVVKGEVKAVKTEKGKRLTPFYTYTHEPFFMKGKKETQMKEVTRLFLSEKGKIVGLQQGYLKKGKGGTHYFVPEKRRD